jgi:hypothetical protein
MRLELEAQCIKLHREALGVDPTYTDELTRELTGGHDVFCPQPYPSDVLHRFCAALLMVARMQAHEEMGV